MSPMGDQSPYSLDFTALMRAMAGDPPTVILSDATIDKLATAIVEKILDETNIQEAPSSFTPLTGNPETSPTLPSAFKTADTVTPEP